MPISVGDGYVACGTHIHPIVPPATHTKRSSSSGCATVWGDRCPQSRLTKLGDSESYSIDMQKDNTVAWYVGTPKTTNCATVSGDSNRLACTIDAHDHVEVCAYAYGASTHDPSTGSIPTTPCVRYHNPSDLRDRTISLRCPKDLSWKYDGWTFIEVEGYYCG